MRIILCLIIVFGIVEVQSQYFDAHLLDDSILYGFATPQEPIIFHFDAVNQTDSTFLVDMIKFEPTIPVDWEISLCTEACFPPDVDEAVFFLDEMATDEVSVYFYAASAGLGAVNIRFENREDSLNAFEYTLYVNAVVNNLEEVENNMPSILMGMNNDFIYIQGDIRNQERLSIYNVNGQALESVLYSPNSPIDISDFPSGIYFIQIYDRLLKFIRF